MKKHKILVVDDDKDLRDVVKLVLEKEGFEVSTAANSTECYDLLEKNKPDLVVLDVVMGEKKDGFEICRDIKANAKYKDVPVMMLTAVNEYFPFDFKADEGWFPSDAFLNKPFEPEVLLNCANRLLGLESKRSGEAKCEFKPIPAMESMRWRDKVPAMADVPNPEQPNLLREIFPYSSVPKITFEKATVPMAPAEEIWMTCTTFRDGQQARVPYTADQIVDLYDLMHRLSGPNGVIRQCEFFLYNKKDREAITRCLARGYRYPEITGWVRASEVDFKGIKWMGLKETGILTSASDYHVYLKMGKNRAKIIDDYVKLACQAIEVGVKPRCHLEDITRADMYGFILPLVQRLMRVAEDSKVPVKIRMCDTMGYGVPFVEASLPRSVPKIVTLLRKEGGVPSAQLEWHGHNDFHLVMANAMAAWLYGCSAVNGTLLGFGERTGNSPLEASCIAYAELTGSTNGMDLKAITDIAKYLENKTGFNIPPNYPFVGKYFNTTMAGIHADGLIKNEEIYNIFDTAEILKRPLSALVNDKSGTAGIALWYNQYIGLTGDNQIKKNDPGVEKVAEWVKEQYADKRVTAISPQELIEQGRKYLGDKLSR